MNPFLQTGMSKSYRQLWLLLLLVGLAILVRGLFLTRWCSNFESDEAIVGLMAKHIQEGHFPVFFYGQFYMGSLESIVAAAIFSTAGDMNGWLLRLSPIVFYLAFMLVSYLWLKLSFSRTAAFWGVLLLAIPPAALTKWTYVARGGFTEVLFLGMLLLYLHQQGLNSGWNAGRLFGLGLVAGLALWTNPLAVLYLATSFIIWTLSSTWWFRWRNYLFKARTLWLVTGLMVVMATILVQFGFKAAMDVIYIQRLLVGGMLVIWVAAITFLRWSQRLRNIPHYSTASHTFWLGLGGILGISPMIYFFFNPTNFTGGRDDFNIITWQRLPELGKLYLFEIFPALIGLRTYTDETNSVIIWLLKIGAALIVAGMVIVVYRRYRASLHELLFLRPLTPQPIHYVWVMGALTLGFGLINGNSYDFEHLRYFTPILFVLAAVVGIALAEIQKSQQTLALFLALALWGYYGLSNFHYYQVLGTECPEQQVVNYLQRQDIKGGWANFQYAYKFTFMSQEKVIITAYRSRERYEAYTQYVTKLSQQTYILKDGPETQQFLAQQSQPDFTQTTVADFNIFTGPDRE